MLVGNQHVVRVGHSHVQASAASEHQQDLKTVSILFVM